ncbi:MAG: mechanosensitive ion channel [Candidatus Aenigmarchaeota archaeon]|nr:mechanosensitive ion channel [Candidatus Aenigmarchaeota archaeon]
MENIKNLFGVDEQVALYIYKALEILVLIVIWPILISLSKGILIKTLKAFKINKSFIGVIISVFKVIAWVFLLAIVLRILGLKDFSLVVFGSIPIAVIAAGIMGAFSSSILGDFIAGIGLALDHDFEVGYKIKLKSKDIEGIIKRIDLRRTRIKDKDSLYIVPNSVIEKEGWILIDKKPDKK